MKREDFAVSVAERVVAVNQDMRQTVCLQFFCLLTMHSDKQGTWRRLFVFSAVLTSVCIILNFVLGLRSTFY